MTSRERLLTALRGGAPDRVPVTIYEHSPHNDGWANREPSYAPLIALEAQYGDTFVWPEYPLPGLLGDPANMTTTSANLPDGVRETRVVVETPRGPLTTVQRRAPEVVTTWKVEPLIKSDADVERLLSIPQPVLPDLRDDTTALAARVDTKGILCFNIGDAVGRVVDVFGFEDFVRRCMRDDGPIRALLAKAQDNLLDVVNLCGTATTNAAFRLWGPEYCGAPLMNPRRFFAPYVVAPDAELTAAIHATGNLSVIHCHGRLRELLDMIAEIGADALEPIETLPLATADVTLAEVKARLGATTCLMGGVQALSLEAAPPAQFAAEVQQALSEGMPGGGYVVLPTAAPFHVPLGRRALANAHRMYEIVHKFGTYD